jgi:alkanesulfonate monooxygenase SsuD/methylene tetrahydromethanopterin reductase-like flavin-dependent oxidoreductase (luciferase family)
MTAAVDGGWSPVVTTEVSGIDGIATLAAVAAARPGTVLGTAIIPLGSRSVPTLAMGAATVAGLTGARFLLGVGVSTEAIVGGWHGQDHDPTLARTRDRLRTLREVLDGGRRGSFRLAEPPGDAVRVLLAAMGPKMTELALEAADGVVANLTPPEDLPEPDGDRLVYSFTWLAAGDDQDTAIRRSLVSYATAPAYARHFTRLGFGAAMEQVQKLRDEGRLREAPATLPQELIEWVRVLPEEMEARTAAIRAAGAEPLYFPITGKDPSADVRSALRSAG